MVDYNYSCLFKLCNNELFLAYIPLVGKRIPHFRRWKKCQALLWYWMKEGTILAGHKSGGVCMEYQLVEECWEEAKGVENCRKQRPYSVNASGLKPQRLRLYTIHTSNGIRCPLSFTHDLTLHTLQLVHIGDDSVSLKSSEIPDTEKLEEGINALSRELLGLFEDLLNPKGDHKSLLHNAGNNKKQMHMESTVKPTRATASGPQSSHAHWNNLQNVGLLSSKPGSSTKTT